MRHFLIHVFAALLFFGCDKQHQLIEFEYTSKVDTSDHPIQPQEKKVYDVEEDGIRADNLFGAARMNDFKKVGQDHYEILINPENSPINMSPWFAFRISAKEIIDSNDMKEWTRSLNSDYLSNSVIGKSRLDRDLLFMDITKGAKSDKDFFIVLSRQHPPEVTGNLAMMAFIEEILIDSELAEQFLDEYRVLVYPMLNPDGVDLGHWRHNEGGIDLNRDWAHYRQPEVRQVCEHIITKVNETGQEVVLGMDFHSTWEDIYYIHDDTVKSSIQGFSKEWIENIFERLPEDEGIIDPFPVNSPVSKNWFYSAFKAEAITYEIGDATPRNLIKTKGKIGVQEMMKLLLGGYKN